MPAINHVSKYAFIWVESVKKRANAGRFWRGALLNAMIAVAEQTMYASLTILFLVLMPLPVAADKLGFPAII